MKKTIIIFAAILFCLMSNIATAQTAHSVHIEKNGVVLTREENQMVYFLENKNADSIKIFVVNHEDRVTKVGDGAFAVSKGVHQEVSFKMAPGEIINLTYIVCVHSTGLMIGSIDDTNFIEANFGSMNTN